MRLILVVLCLLMACFACLPIKAYEIESEDLHLSAGNITLLDYEGDSLEPRQDPLEAGDSRETLPSVRREKRSSDAHLSPRGRHTRRSHLLDRRVHLSNVGHRHGRGILDRLLKFFRGGDDEPSEAEKKYNNLNEKIFVLPSSYLVPDSEAGLWSEKVEEALKNCTKATDIWSCTYLKMGRKDAKFSMSELTRWLRSSSSGPTSLHEGLSALPASCGAFWRRFVREERRRLFLAELEREVERRTADHAGHRWRRGPSEDESQWAALEKLRRQKLREAEEHRKKVRRMNDLKGREGSLTAAERGELTRLRAAEGGGGESLLGSNLVREEGVLRQEGEVLATCLAHGMLKACEETLMAALRSSLV